MKTYKLAPNVTEYKLKKMGFKLTYEWMFRGKGDSTIAIKTRIEVSNFKSEEPVGAVSFNKTDLNTTTDITPYILDLIQKGLVIEND